MTSLCITLLLHIKNKILTYPGSHPSNDVLQIAIDLRHLIRDSGFDRLQIPSYPVHFCRMQFALIVQLILDSLNSKRQFMHGSMKISVFVLDFRLKNEKLATIRNLRTKNKKLTLNSLRFSDM
jgi:hypothetical protein